MINIDENLFHQSDDQFTKKFSFLSGLADRIAYLFAILIRAYCSILIWFNQYVSSFFWECSFQFFFHNCTTYYV